MGYFAGFAAALGAAIAFGVQYVPVKQYEIFDGTTFQWFMCNGILFVGIIIALSCQQLDGCPLQVVLGGVLWGLSNYLVLPLVKLLGIGLGFSMYHFVNLSLAYLIGRLGIFGVPPASEIFQGSLYICDFGFAMVLASFVGLTFVEQEESSLADAQSALPPPIVQGIDEEYREMYRRWRLGESQGSTDLPVGSLDVDAEIIGLRYRGRGAQNFSVGGFSIYGSLTSLEMTRQTSVESGGSAHAGAQGAAAESPANKAADKKVPLTKTSPVMLPASPIPRAQSDPSGASTRQVTAELLPDTVAEAPTASRLQKKLLGVVLALVSGGMCAVQSVPATLYNNAHPEKLATASVFPQCVGIWLASTAVYLLYAVIAKIQRWRVPHSVIRPAFVAGGIWASGFGLMIVAIQDLGFSIAYTLDAVGPIIVSSLLSIFVFKEIRGKRQLTMFVGVEAVQLVGVVLIACFSKQG